MWAVARHRPDVCALIAGPPRRGGDGGAGRGRSLRHEPDSDNVSQYDVGAGGALAPLSPATVAAGSSPVRGGGQPGRSERLRRERRQRQRLPVRRRRGRGARRPRARPRSPRAAARTGWRSARTERASTSRTRSATTSPSTTSARAGRSRPRARPRSRAGSGPRGVAVSPDGASVYVANVLRRQRLPVRRRRGRGAHAQEPGHGRRGQLTRSGWRSARTAASVYVTNFAQRQRLPVRRRRGRGAHAQEPGHGRRGQRPARGGGQPGRSERLRRERRRQQRLPVRRRRGRGAHAQEPGHGRRGQRPVRGGGQPGRGERLRRQRCGGDNVSQYDVGAGGALTPKSPATVAAGTARAGWRSARCRAFRPARTSARTAAGATSPASRTRATA